MRLLLVTNDFPPRFGGIQTYLHNLYAHLKSCEVTVLAPAQPGDSAFDSRQPFEVIRHDGSVWGPAPALRRRVHSLVRSRRADAIAFGAMLPMNLIASGFDVPVVVHTHGFEVGWARVPAARSVMRAIARRAVLLTVVSEFTAPFLRQAAGAGTRVELLRTGVDLERFHPAVDAGPIRARHHLGDRPVVCCVSRLVARKGQDRLIEVLPTVRREIGDVVLMLVGDGPARRRLEGLARGTGAGGAVVFAGEAADSELAAYYRAGSVFAMPVRSRLAGLEVEGLGLVYLEAQACGVPVITGDSGGAPEAVRPGETGFVVGGSDRVALADAIVRTLRDDGLRASMGAAGRAFVEKEHSWGAVAARYGAMLDAIG